MRSVIHRRHSLRRPGDVHLSPEGIELARRVGRSSGPFDRVVTSPKPRAVETAVAMGLAVDAEIPELGALPDPVARFLEREPPSTFGEFVRMVAEVVEVRECAEGLATLLAHQLTLVPEGGRLLVISHAGLVELGATGVAGERVARWGPTLGPLEGVRLDRDGARWGHAEVLRLGT
ncbi:MAG: histidine phosphatase family protein [Thermoplasmata archaeon]|nr:histidine phosphatase family protein [Thermoplasmata archaeon]